MPEHALPFMGALSIAPRLFCATLLGIMIGVERLWRQQSTGLTTHALVALGAAIYTSLPSLLNELPDARMGGQVVTGIGFLGAGLIMRDGLTIRGLSTAATVWATGAIGVLSGYGLILEAIEGAILIVLINATLPKLNSYIERRRPQEQTTERFYVITLKTSLQEEVAIRTKLLTALTQQQLRLHRLESHTIEEGTAVEVEALVHSFKEEDQLIESLIGALSAAPEIYYAKWASTNPPA